MTGEKSLIDQVRNQHATLSSDCLAQPLAVTCAWLGALLLLGPWGWLITGNVQVVHGSFVPIQCIRGAKAVRKAAC